jgi:hypothetical protein
VKLKRGAVDDAGSPKKISIRGEAGVDGGAIYPGSQSSTDRL